MTVRYPDSAIREILEAAKRSSVMCPVTGITVTTPFLPRAWAVYLISTRYPNYHAALTLIKCLREGVDLGFRGDRTLTQVGPNLVSATQHPDAIVTNMTKETSLGRRHGPYHAPPFSFFYSNPLGIVFKRASTKPRVVHHLSWPRSRPGTSVNASTLTFDIALDAFDIAIRSVRQLGAGCYMVKLDIEAAYRCIPVRPADWPLLGMRWTDGYYFDSVVQFGLSSATAIFEWYSSAAQHIAQVALAIEHIVHYIDDFLIFASTQREAERIKRSLLQLFTELGIPLSIEKVEGPVRLIIFLGIVFDSVSMTVKLDERRLADLHEELSVWSNRTQASREQLQSLIGRLSFASKVVPTGRTFLRRMIDQLKLIPVSAPSTEPHPLTPHFFKDLAWWGQFLSKWNGVSVVPDADWSTACSLHIYTDACVTGYGAVFGSHWFAGQWSDEQNQQASRDHRDSMPFKELYALTLAANTWGSQWTGRKILFHCDSMTAVLAWRKGDSPDPHISELIRTLLFIAATHDFNMNVVHVPGLMNTYADMLSRGQVPDFLSSHAAPDRSPTIPLPLPTHTW